MKSGSLLSSSIQYDRHPCALLIEQPECEEIITKLNDRLKTARKQISQTWK